MDKKTKKVLFTGGGSSGHVTPNIALINKFKQILWDVEYIGSKEGIEKIIIKQQNIPYHAISTGKLRRYFSRQNFIDPFKIFLGICQAFFIIKKINPQIVFSKGGFVSFPVVVAAWLNQVPVIVHESDLTPGLANKLNFYFAQTICTTFLETKNYIKQKAKILYTGALIREGLFQGDKDKAKILCGFDDEKSVLLIVGGGLGAKVINEFIWQHIDILLKEFNVIHIAGQEKTNTNIEKKGYKQFEYLNEEYFDVMALADIVISRAGSNALYELLILKKPHILIPLTLQASRGDQIHNANYYAKKGVSIVVEQDNVASQLLPALKNLKINLKEKQEKLIQINAKNGTDEIFQLLLMGE